jgi:hypothetical protein
MSAANFRSNFPQQFSAANFRSNFPQQISAANFRLSFPLLGIRHNFHEMLHVFVIF